MAEGARVGAPAAKLVVLAVVALGLVGVLALAAAEEARPRPAAAPATAGGADLERKPLSREEEAYAQALWPIHTDVKFAAVRLASGSVQVVLGKIAPGELRPRVEQAATVLQQAETRASLLRPPTSMADLHSQYLRAIQLYRQSRDELALMFVDTSEQHLRAALGPRLEADKILREIGSVLWPNEYVPS